MEANEAIETVSDFAIVGPDGFIMENRPIFMQSDAGIARLGSLVKPLEGLEIDWDRVDQVAQAAFSGLTQRVLASQPGLEWKAKSYQSKFIKLATYRIFNRADRDDFDPIYVGITLHEVGSGIRISGDISGDETGHVYFDRGCDRIVEIRGSAVLDAVREIAGRLAMQDRIVAEAVRTRHSEASPE
jgi:hypothetical protein